MLENRRFLCSSINSSSRFILLISPKQSSRARPRFKSVRVTGIGRCETNFAEFLKRVLHSQAICKRRRTPRQGTHLAIARGTGHCIQGAAAVSLWIRLCLPLFFGGSLSCPLMVHTAAPAALLLTHLIFVYLLRAFITRFCTHRAPHIAARAPRFAARAPRSGGCTASVARAVLCYCICCCIRIAKPLSRACEVLACGQGV